MGPAVRGVLKHLQARLQANPGRKVVLVLASDGLPGGCARNDIPSIAMDINAAFMATPSIPTYVIGVFSQTELARAQPQLDQLAMGGGTNKRLRAHRPGRSEHAPAGGAEPDPGRGPGLRIQDPRPR